MASFIDRARWNNWKRRRPLSIGQDGITEKRWRPSSIRQDVINEKRWRILSVGQDGITEKDCVLYR